MKYPEKIWVIYQGEPYFIDYYSTSYDKYLLKKNTAREYEVVKEDVIEDIYPVEDIPTFTKGQTVVTLTGQIIQIMCIDEGDYYKRYCNQDNDWFTPFEITAINY